MTTKTEDGMDQEMERMLSPAEVIRATGISRNSLKAMAARGDFPMPRQHGIKLVWRESEVKEWLEAPEREWRKAWKYRTPTTVAGRAAAAG